MKQQLQEPGFQPETKAEAIFESRCDVSSVTHTANRTILATMTCLNKATGNVLCLDRFVMSSERLFCEFETLHEEAFSLKTIGHLA